MKIDDEHMYHGAALTQIAKDPRFSGIGPFQHESSASKRSFIINGAVGVYLQYSKRPVSAFNEYHFSFGDGELTELGSLRAKTESVALALVCVQDGEICAVPYEELLRLIDLRRTAYGRDEEMYVIAVKVLKGRMFRVYVSAPGKDGRMLDDAVKVARSKFPARLFDDDGAGDDEDETEDEPTAPTSGATRRKPRNQRPSAAT